jgi:hypothetical protein
VNLARLHIRAGDGDAGYQLIERLFDAVNRRTDTVIDGIFVPVADLIASDHDHHELRTWLWTVDLADGTRALTSAGRWADAEEHLRRRNGIGNRMLDGDRSPLSPAPPQATTPAPFVCWPRRLPARRGKTR